MATFLIDTFTDTDNTNLSAHAANTGGTWEACDFSLSGTSSNTTDAIVSSNRLRGSATATTRRTGRCPAAPTTAEYDITADFVVNNVDSASYNWALGARLTATGTTSANVDRYYGRYVGAAGAASRQWQIAKVVSNTITTLASAAEDISAGTHSVLFEVRDSAKRLVVGGVQKVTTADNAITQVGRVGVSVGGYGASTATPNAIDNISAADAGVVSVARAIGIDGGLSLPTSGAVAVGAAN